MSRAAAHPDALFAARPDAMHHASLGARMRPFLTIEIAALFQVPCEHVLANGAKAAGTLRAAARFVAERRT